jgi:hypothetical protein
MRSLSLLLLCSLASAAWGQGVGEPKEADAGLCELKFTEEQLANPPERKIKVEQSETANDISLKDLGPQLVDQKFTASALLRLPGDIDLNPRGLQRFRIIGEDDPLMPLQFFAGNHILLPNYPALNFLNGSQQGELLYRESAVQSLARIVHHVPEDRLPPQADIDFLTSESVDPFLRSAGARGSRQRQSGAYRELVIPGETAAIAERRLRSLLTILDQGVSRPLQLRWFAILRESCVQREMLQAEVDKLAREAEATAAEAGAIGEVGAEMLPELRLRQVQEEVDLAGVVARLEACEKQLAGDIGEDRRRQLESTKGELQIERAGVEARKARLGEFVARVQSKASLLAKVETAQVALKSLRAKLRAREAQISELTKELAWLAPLPLVDDKITVQPVTLKP